MKAFNFESKSLKKHNLYTQSVFPSCSGIVALARLKRTAHMAAAGWDRDTEHDHDLQGRLRDRDALMVEDNANTVPGTVPCDVSGQQRPI